MTTIIFYNDKSGSYKGFVCMGHAEYAKKGKPDILCSAISTLVISTINSLEELAKEKMDVTTNEKDGFIKCDFKSNLQEKSIFLVDSLVFSLKKMSEQYGKNYLQVKFEEV